MYPLSHCLYKLSEMTRAITQSTHSLSTRARNHHTESPERRHHSPWSTSIVLRGNDQPEFAFCSKPGLARPYRAMLQTSAAIRKPRTQECDRGGRNRPNSSLTRENTAISVYTRLGACHAKSETDCRSKG
jgi:hypothetical protein